MQMNNFEFPEHKETVRRDSHLASGHCQSRLIEVQGTTDS
jgi:hypothetical protein